MTTAILVAGLVVTLLVAYVMRRPESRLAALLFAFLAIPGNLDNLLPQMRLDPHAIANNTAPAISFVDLLIIWAVILTVREGRFRGWPPELRWLAALIGAFGVLAAIATVLNAFQGVDLAAAVRGVLVMARVPALLGLALALRDTIGDGRRVAIGMTLGLVGLLGNGLYTSGQLATTRFTAATFGHNGFSLALVTGALIATGLAIDFRRRGEGRRMLAAACFALAGAGLFGAIATGTRMSLLVAIPAMLVALLVNRSWWNRRGAIGVAMLATGVLAVALAATLWTAEGGRALSGITDPGETVDVITNPEEASSASSVRTRTRWWSQAIAMARDDPLTGVGPYQWNILRYETDHEAKPVVADPHNTYIQIAAEYGVPVLGAYLLGLATLIIVVLLTVWRPLAPSYQSTIATAIGAAALMIPVTELTNSHFFNVRLGAVAWLLLGVTLTLTVAPVLAARASSITSSMSAAEPDGGLGDQASRAAPKA